MVSLIHRDRLPRWPLCLVLAASLELGAFPVVAADSPGWFEAQRNQRETTFRQRVREITDGLGSPGPSQAYEKKLAEIRRFPHQQLLFLTDAVFLEEGSDAKMVEATREHAAHLAALARTAIDQGQPALAYQALHEVAYFDPEEPHARAILQLERNSRQRSPVARLASRRHPQLRWARRRYWVVRTDHYEILTNQSKQAAIALAEQLEDLHTVWRQLFFDGWSDQASLKMAWQRGVPLRPATRQRHRVILFASREQYVKYLLPHQPRIEMTLGFYDVGSRTSYFFAGPDSSPATQVHEATHQLFQELQPDLPQRIPEQNFWILEGIALYMESLRRQGPCVRVGGFYAERLQYARYRCLQEDFYLPLAELVEMGRDALQDDPRIRRLYSQAAGLTHFFMDSGHGNYQSGIVDYLRRVYRGRDGHHALSLATDTSLATLDTQYREFLTITDRDLQETQVPENSLQSLCLGRTAVTDEGLAALSRQRKLHWLDLAHLGVTDRGLAFLDGATELRQVNLERTGITDRTIAWISASNQMEELDVSYTNITDAGIELLAGLPNLRTLWLRGTRITDDSVKRLASLKKLDLLDVSGTGITAGGREVLRHELPDVTLH